ncbi:hypothetical protein PNOK_0672300 [Pyrrhoderma noxium]|uniref:Uncharacterized protein n=1 Tax=Pyrrhoderma noxium TaxID=2282107 RepID=A0A286UF86_9AGAM|nr:hypothetical protein PNOK_0672300 [Pyrrhoderma noxium]
MSNPKPGLNSVTLEVANVISSFEIDTKTNTVARFFSLRNSQFTDTFASEELLVNFVKGQFLKRASRIREERKIAAANKRAERMNEETGEKYKGQRLHRRKQEMQEATYPTPLDQGDVERKLSSYKRY